MLTCGNVLRFRRGDAVYVGADDDKPVFCFVIRPGTEPRHRADVTLSPMQYAFSGLRPDCRIRCIPRVVMSQGEHIGELGESALRVMFAAMKRELAMRQFEAVHAVVVAMQQVFNS